MSNPHKLVKESLSVTLTPAQLAWLTAMSTKYELGTVQAGKAWRVLLNFGLRDGDRKAIFTDANVKAAGAVDAADKANTVLTFEAYTHQAAWARDSAVAIAAAGPPAASASAAVAIAADVGRALRALLEYARALTPAPAATATGAASAAGAAAPAVTEEFVWSKVRCNDLKCTHQH